MESHLELAPQETIESVRQKFFTHPVLPSKSTAPSEGIRRVSRSPRNTN